jgi:gamma-glutamyl hercynylcysteine S-oxide synthase
MTERPRSPWLGAATSAEQSLERSVGAHADDVRVWRAGASVLGLALMDARNHSLHLAAAIEAVATQSFQREIAATLGAVAWFAEHWIARNPKRGLGALDPGDGVRMASVEPLSDGWWSFEAWRAGLRSGFASGLPDLAATRAYMLDVSETVGDLLDRLEDRHDDAALHHFRMALAWEDLLGERLLHRANALGCKLKGYGEEASRASPREPLLCPASEALLGHSGEGFAWDNEQPTQRVRLPEFEIDAQPVSWAQFVEFVDDGGYDRRELWTDAGWSWLQLLEASGEARRAPQGVDQIGVASGAVMQQHFGRLVRRASHASVSGVSAFEADAFARWIGRRVATESEWEHAARTAAGRGFRFGDVWEWTSNRFAVHDGFASGPWRAYTQSGLDVGARALRGASWATRARSKRVGQRGFAAPERDALAFGFRTCAL